VDYPQQHWPQLWQFRARPAPCLPRSSNATGNVWSIRCQQYLAALVKHDPKAVPFAEEVKFVENTADIRVGKGLWITASGGPTEFQIYAADPVAQQVACLVMMKENNNDILLGARLKLESVRITEAEHLVIRELGTSRWEQGAAGQPEEAKAWTGRRSGSFRAHAPLADASRRDALTTMHSRERTESLRRSPPSANATRTEW